MDSGLYVTLSGAVAQGQAFDVAANNIANASTTGYKAERLHFNEALTRASGKSNADQHYVELAGTRLDGRPGTLHETGNPLDLALQGDGYFVVDTDRGARLTRAGDFRVDTAGRIVNGQDFPLRRREGGAFVVPTETSSLRIDRDGSVRALREEGGASMEDTILGTIEIARARPEDLVREGSNLFSSRVAPTLASHQAPDFQQPEVLAGTLEGGNYNSVRGMVDLVRISRTHDALHRMLESYKQIDERTARSLGGGR